uniref:Cystathionine gamma-lyase n=1 Tax=Acrobeloides nanus TaxID=290746 RepID=A0A914CCQ3_9BILA
MVAKLEEAEDALGFASGMAAISAVALTLLEPGDKLVCVKNCYPDAYRLFEVILKRFKINVVYVDGLDLPAINEALYGAKLFYTESPTSWTMEALEVGALAKLAHKHGAFVAIDNSWASPIFQKPIKLGVDIVIHTASKYLGGHSDVIAGVIASSKTMIDKIRDSRLYVGGKLSPFDAWLLIRGLRTLPIRVKAVGESALELARRLSKNPMVEKVCHPGLEKLPDGLIGTTGLFSFVFKENVNIQIFIDALKIFKIGVSWGGHESLILPASIVLQQAAQPNSATDFGVSPRSVRIYIGLEGTENLWQDLSEAINSASEYRR